MRQFSRSASELPSEWPQPSVEGYHPPGVPPELVPDAPAEEVDVPIAVEPPAPAAGRTGSVTSTYAAPAEPAFARTALAASHFPRAFEESPKYTLGPPRICATRPCPAIADTCATFGISGPGAAASSLTARSAGPVSRGPPGGTVSGTTGSGELTTRSCSSIPSLATATFRPATETIATGRRSSPRLRSTRRHPA